MAEVLILLPGSFSQNTGQVPEMVPEKFPSLLKSVFPKKMREKSEKLHHFIEQMYFFIIIIIILVWVS